MNELEIHRAVKDFILREFLPNETADNLKDSTELIATGIIDSIATLRLVAFLEVAFAIRIAPEEAILENLHTIEAIATMVHRKQKADR